MNGILDVLERTVRRCQTVGGARDLRTRVLNGILDCPHLTDPSRCMDGSGSPAMNARPGWRAIPQPPILFYSSFDGATPGFHPPIKRKGPAPCGTRPKLPRHASARQGLV